MFERFTDRARRVVVLAQEEARMLNHNYIGTEKDAAVERRRPGLTAAQSRFALREQGAQEHLSRPWG